MSEAAQSHSAAKCELRFPRTKNPATTTGQKQPMKRAELNSMKKEDVAQAVNCLRSASRGRGGIRTLGGFNTTAAFQATALNRYATRPS